MGKPLSIQKSLPINPQRSDPQKYQKQQDDKLKKVAKLYEQQFLNQMVKAMRKTVQHSQLMKPSFAENLYREQLDQEYVKKWSGQGGVGLSDTIYEQLKETISRQRGVSPSPPKGPIDVDQKGPLPIQNEKKSQPFQMEKTSDMSFLIEKTSTHPGGESVVTSPWEGVVHNAYEDIEGRQFVQVNHKEEGLQSILSFIGKRAALKIGEPIEAGQELGRLSEQGKGIVWALG